MRGFFLHLLPWAIMFTLGFAAGDRYGAPAWLKGPADQGLTIVEETVAEPVSNAIDSVVDMVPFIGGEEEEVVAEEEAVVEEAPAEEEATEEAVEETGSEEGVEGEEAPVEEEAAEPLPENEALTTNEAGLEIIGEMPAEEIASVETKVIASLRAPASENQFSAMVSLASASGMEAFAASDVLSKFNAGDAEGAAEAFRAMAGEPHLVERRERERMLFLK